MLETKCLYVNKVYLNNNVMMKMGISMSQNETFLSRQSILFQNISRTHRNPAGTVSFQSPLSLIKLRCFIVQENNWREPTDNHSCEYRKYLFNISIVVFIHVF